jgi:hypothetical protein
MPEPSNQTHCRYLDPKSQECGWMDDEFYPAWMDVDTPIVEPSTCDGCPTYRPALSK